MGYDDCLVNQTINEPESDLNNDFRIPSVSPLLKIGSEVTTKGQPSTVDQTLNQISKIEASIKDCPPSPLPVKEVAKVCHKSTMDVSQSSNSEEVSLKSDEYVPISQKPKRRKRRRDVVFKTILRECRRYFQIQLSSISGFITSKKPRKDDYMYQCMQKFNQQVLKKQGTFDENFYLAWLLYPQDLSRSLDTFFTHLDQTQDLEKVKAGYRDAIKRIHDTLYRYSHDKLEFFAGKPEIAYLFCHFYENGAGPDKNNPKFVEEYEFVRTKCMDTLNKSD